MTLFLGGIMAVLFYGSMTLLVKAQHNPSTAQAIAQLAAMVVCWICIGIVVGIMRRGTKAVAETGQVLAVGMLSMVGLAVLAAALSAAALIKVIFGAMCLVGLVLLGRALLDPKAPRRPELILLGLGFALVGGVMVVAGHTILGI